MCRRVTESGAIIAHLFDVRTPFKTRESYPTEDLIERSQWMKIQHQPSSVPEPDQEGRRSGENVE